MSDADNLKPENKKYEITPEPEDVNKLEMMEQVQALFPSELKNLLLDEDEPERVGTKDDRDIQKSSTQRENASSQKP